MFQTRFRRPLRVQSCNGSPYTKFRCVAIVFDLPSNKRGDYFAVGNAEIRVCHREGHSLLTDQTRTRQREVNDHHAESAGEAQRGRRPLRSDPGCQRADEDAPKE